MIEPNIADINDLNERLSGEELRSLKQVDVYLNRGGRIEKRHGLICLADENAEYIVGGKTTQEMLERLDSLMT